jgi:hypothetical protein
MEGIEWAESSFLRILFRLAAKRKRGGSEPGASLIG